MRTSSECAIHRWRGQRSTRGRSASLRRADPNTARAANRRTRQRETSLASNIISAEPKSKQLARTLHVMLHTPALACAHAPRAPFAGGFISGGQVIARTRQVSESEQRREQRTQALSAGGVELLASRADARDVAVVVDRHARRTGRAATARAVDQAQVRVTQFNQRACGFETR